MIDEKDWDILEALQNDGRATYGEIGQRVGLAASSVHERVRKLERRGVISGYGPRIDRQKLGPSLVAFVSLVTSEACSSLAPVLEAWPEVEEFHSVAGEECAILKVRAADTDGLQDVLDRLRALPTVERTRSTIVLKTRWDQRSVERPAISSPPGGTAGDLV